MKNVIFALFLASVTAGASAAVTCTNYGNMTNCYGTDQNGQPVNTTTQQFGNMTTTTGNVGGSSVNTTTQQYGNMTTTSGHYGDQQVHQTCLQYGNMTTCH